jgi:acetyl/propionyl-CoA carboxylase alpha subunit
LDGKLILNDISALREISSQLALRPLDEALEGGGGVSMKMVDDADEMERKKQRRRDEEKEDDDDEKKDYKQVDKGWCME